ncbi:MAG: hypothetical protein ACEQSB_04790 [Undibacterium sp.]
MSTRFVLSLLLALCAPLTAKAADCYFLLGYGSGQFSRSYTEKLEDKLLGSRYIDGAYAINSHSQPYQLGGGCNLGRYAAVEADYFQGYHHEVVTTAALCVNALGERVCTKPGLLRRTASLEGWELSLLGKYPLTERVSLTGRLGVLSGVARVSVSFPESSEPVSLSMEERGMLPILGVGLLYQANREFSLSVEAVTFDANYSRLMKLVARWSF